MGVPRRNTPWWLTGLAGISILAALVLVPLIVVYEGNSNSNTAVGRSLWIQSERPKVQRYFHYQATNASSADGDWLMVAANRGHELTMIEVTLENNTRASQSFTINQDAAVVRLRDGAIARPIDTAVHSQAYSGPPNSREELMDFVALWGDIEVKKGEHVGGYLVFEVPTGSQVASLDWTAAEFPTTHYR